MNTFRLVSILSLTTLLMTLSSCGRPNQTSVSETNLKTEQSQDSVSKMQNKNVDYMTSLGLMKGHLIVAKELLDKGKPQAAEPHVGHPVEELYGDIEAELTERNVPQFKATLTQLHDLLKTNPNNAQIPQKYQEAVAGIDTAIAAIPETDRQSSPFVLMVITHLLDTAQEEYSAAVADGKVVELLEYQDSRGFVLYAEQLYQTIAPSLSQEKPDIDQAVSNHLTALKQAWPSVEPPPSVKVTPDQVSQLVSKIDEQAQL